jgi:hypothetical protein
MAHNLAAQYGVFAAKMKRKSDTNGASGVLLPARRTLTWRRRVAY